VWRTRGCPQLESRPAPAVYNACVPDVPRPLRVLITNTALENRAGSELYVRDLALELLRRGHRPMVYSPRLGDVAREIRRATIPVVDDPASIGSAPDLIHGQHHLETMSALARFPGVPAVYVCHGWLPWEETPPVHPRILAYVAVSEAVRDRIVYERGVPLERTTIIGNFVDMARFLPRAAPLASSPRTALLFDNHAMPDGYAQAIREACALAGVALDVLGLYYGNAVSEPERLLGRYDVVFARGRAALESLAVGAAVICCGKEGAGPMVARANLDRLLRQNFGIQAMDRPITVDWALEQLRAYDAADAAAVSAEIRSRSSMRATIDRITDLYATTLTAWEVTRAGAPVEERAIAESRSISAYARWLSLSLSQQRHDVVALQSEHGRLMEESRALRAELDRQRGTLTWRLYEKVARVSFARRAYRLFASPFKRGRSRFASSPAPSADVGDRDEQGEPRPADPARSAFPPLPPRDPSEGPELACVVMSLGNPPSLVPAVRSLLDQDEPVEIVVVNSGGGDPAASLKVAGIDARVISHASLLWPGATRNEGILATRAPYLAFLAADCIAEPGWAAGRLARHRAGSLMVSSAVTNLTARNLWSWVSHVALFSTRMPGLPASRAVHYGISYDRRLFDRFGIFREDLRVGEDSELNERLAGVPVDWAPDVRASHAHPVSLRGLLGDQRARGGRMATGLRRLTGGDLRWRVARNAVARIPALARAAWRGCLPGERAFVAAAVPFLLPAAASYALGALGARGEGGEEGAPARRHRLLALLAVHDEAAHLPGWLANVAPQVDGIVALDDGSTDRSAAILAAHPSLVELMRLPARVPHVWDEPRNRRLLVEAALRHGAEWIIVVDADERLESGFREKVEAEIARAGREANLAYRVTLRELWNAPDRYRVDGVWGSKQPPRLFRARADHRFDDRAFHGYWAPLNSLRSGDCPTADVIVYHLRMIRAADRLARRQRYEQLDPDNEHQSIGYGYLTDETGLALETVPAGRHYEPMA
jgi:glycosyltransferase involved in cell wall biosynthesis